MCVVKLNVKHDLPDEGECYKVVDVASDGTIYSLFKFQIWNMGKWVKATVSGDPHPDDFVGITAWLTKEAAIRYLNKVRPHYSIVNSKIVRCEYKGVRGVGKIKEGMVGDSIHRRVLVVDELRIMEFV